MDTDRQGISQPPVGTMFSTGQDTSGEAVSLESRNSSITGTGTGTDQAPPSFEKAGLEGQGQAAALEKVGGAATDGKVETVGPGVAVRIKQKLRASAITYVPKVHDINSTAFTLGCTQPSSTALDPATRKRVKAELKLLLRAGDEEFKDILVDCILEYEGPLVEKLLLFGAKDTLHTFETMHMVRAGELLIARKEGQTFNPARLLNGFSNEEKSGLGRHLLRNAVARQSPDHIATALKAAAHMKPQDVVELVTNKDLLSDYIRKMQQQLKSPQNAEQRPASSTKPDESQSMHNQQVRAPRLESQKLDMTEEDDACNQHQRLGRDEDCQAENTQLSDDIDGSARPESPLVQEPRRGIAAEGGVRGGSVVQEGYEEIGEGFDFEAEAQEVEEGTRTPLVEETAPQHNGDDMVAEEQVADFVEGHQGRVEYSPEEEGDDSSCEEEGEDTSDEEESDESSCGEEAEDELTRKLPSPTQDVTDTDASIAIRSHVHISGSHVETLRARQQQRQEPSRFFSAGEATERVVGEWGSGWGATSPGETSGYGWQQRQQVDTGVSGDTLRTSLHRRQTVAVRAIPESHEEDIELLKPRLTVPAFAWEVQDMPKKNPLVKLEALLLDSVVVNTLPMVLDPLKELLSSAYYDRVGAYSPALSYKLTGMMMALHVEELERGLECEAVFHEQVAECMLSLIEKAIDEHLDITADMIMAFMDIQQRFILESLLHSQVAELDLPDHDNVLTVLLARSAAEQAELVCSRDALNQTLRDFDWKRALNVLDEQLRPVAQLVCRRPGRLNESDLQVILEDADEEEDDADDVQDPGAEQPFQPLVANVVQASNPPDMPNEDAPLPEAPATGFVERLWSSLCLLARMWDRWAREVVARGYEVFVQVMSRVL